LLDPGPAGDGDPDFGPSAFVYRRYHLLRTHAILRARHELLLPSETPHLIEAVYGEKEPVLEPGAAANLKLARDEMEALIQESRHQAKKRLVLAPDRDDLLTQRSEDLLEEENPAQHPALQALTREAPPGVSLVCLHRLLDGQVVLEPDQPGRAIDLDREPTWAEVKDLLRHAVQLQRPELVRHFAAQPPYSTWKENAALRFVHPVVFEDGLARFDGMKILLRLDRELGLLFEKEVL
jgi:hypothetical protein